MTNTEIKTIFSENILAPKVIIVTTEQAASIDEGTTIDGYTVDEIRCIGFGIDDLQDEATCKRIVNQAKNSMAYEFVKTFEVVFLQEGKLFTRVDSDERCCSFTIFGVSRK